MYVCIGTDSTCAGASADGDGRATAASAAASDERRGADDLQGEVKIRELRLEVRSTLHEDSGK